ncbi:MAG: sigma-54-dependent Fis family transcriptional regulator, partial [Planctomycetaceae bacterium]
APFDAVVCDLHLPDRDGLEVLAHTRHAAPETPVIMLTGFGSITSAVDAMRQGASDYLSKPVGEDELQHCIEQALRRRPLLSENKRLQSEIDLRLGLGEIVGSDPTMVRLFDMIESVADSKSTVLMLGESGTGKTITARALHQLSSRADKPFVEVACGALSDSLLDSELFGHVAGSFTGATRDRAGKFLQADGGTIFLDEIATASPGLQVKLLRVLQERQFEPVGGSRTHQVDVRLILATNADLEDKVRRGEFRQDLFYRINVISLVQPPLRDRRGDIALLAEHHRARLCREMGRKITGFSDAALAALLRHSWPGNVRELVNVVERAVVLCRRTQIGLEDLPEMVKRALVDVDMNSDGAISNPLRMALASPERKIILDALAASGWNRQETAERLGINRTTLYKKMKRLGIEGEIEEG